MSVIYKKWNNWNKELMQCNWCTQISDNDIFQRYENEIDIKRNFLERVFSLSFTFNHSKSFVKKGSILKMRQSIFVIIVAVLNVTIRCQVRGEKAYLFNTASQMNWFKANVFCETNNMRLVSIHSLEEHNFILGRADELGKNWNCELEKSYSKHRIFVIESRLEKCTMVDSR